MHMQVILDSSFARPGSAPIWGGKKGEFRDWTKRSHAELGLLMQSLIYRLPFSFSYSSAISTRVKISNKLRL